MKMHLTEEKAQRWRVVAKIKTPTGQEETALVYVGQSIVQAREGYLSSWHEMKEEVRRATTKLVIEKWLGAPDYGHWQAQSHIPLPSI